MRCFPPKRACGSYDSSLSSDVKRFTLSEARLGLSLTLQASVRWAVSTRAVTRTRRGGITKAGYAHLRRVIVEAAWAYRHRPGVGAALGKRQATASAEVKEIAWKAQHRVHGRYRALTARGKCKQQVVTAIGRELLGFIWAIGVHVESRTAHGKPIAA